MKTKLLFIIALFSTIVYGQTFTRNFPFTQITSVYSMGSCAPIVQTSDGGYILNYFYTYPDIHGGPYYSEIIKTDSSFVPLWKKELWGSNGKKTFTFSDGSSILFGNSDYYTYPSFSLEKFDSNGQTIWRKNDFEVFPYKISIQDAILKDINTIKFAGTKEMKSGGPYSSNPILMNFDTDGNYIQGISLSIPSIDAATIESICQETSGNYYVIIKNLTSRYIAKFSATDSLIWCEKLSFNSYEFYEINSTTVLNNGDLLIGGSYNNYSLDKLTFALVRITTDGNLVWSKTINDFKTSISNIKEIATNEIIATGIIYEDILKRNVIMKIDGNGDLIWSKKYSNAFSISEVYQKTSNDWYYSAFSSSLTDTHPFLFNTENNGNTTCNSENMPFNFVNNPDSLTTTSLTTNSLTLLTPSIVNNGQSESQTYDDNCLSLAVKNFNQNNEDTIYPNPSGGLINVSSQYLINKITINTILGQRVNLLYPNSTSTKIDIESSGIYLINVDTENGTKTFKVIITK